LVGAVGIEPSSPLQTRKLLIERFDKFYRNAKNAQVKYQKRYKRHGQLRAHPPFRLLANCQRRHHSAALLSVAAQGSANLLANRSATSSTGAHLHQPMPMPQQFVSQTL
jgi:hypothetical protein